MTNSKEAKIMNLELRVLTPSGEVARLDIISLFRGVVVYTAVDKFGRAKGKPIESNIGDVTIQARVDGEWVPVTVPEWQFEVKQ